MSSLHWDRTFGQSWTAAGSLWSRTVSRIHLNWTTRFIDHDEETLVLTHNDELNRTYSDHRGGPSSTGPDITSLTQRQRPDGSSSALQHSSPDLKDTRVTVVSTGAGNATVTSAVSTAGNQAKNNFPEKTEGKETGEGTSELWVSLGEEPERRNLVNLGQSLGGVATGQSPCPTITAWEAGWNVTNAIQGIFVLGLPFALVHSGYAGLVLLVLSAWLCNHTGRILVTCLYEEEPSGGSKVRVRHSYQDIVEACSKGLWSSCPGLAGWMVNAAQVVELLMTCTLYLVVSTSLLSDSLTGTAVPRSVCSLVSLLFLLPCLLLTDLRRVSTLSFFCSLAHVLISLMVMLYCLSRSSSWSWSALSLSVDPEDFLVSVGVIIFSYTSQIFLPPLEGSMEDRGQFNTMLGWTHGAACVMKSMFSLLAVLTWGTETREVITDNLPSELRPVVNLCLLAKALLSYPLPFYSAAEILQSCLRTDSAVSSYSNLGGGGGGVSRPALLLRGALLMTSLLLALLVPRFSLLMGLTGSVTGSAMTLILPCVFHLRLRWTRLGLRERLTDVAILSLGVVCSVSGVICSVKRLVGTF